VCKRRLTGSSQRDMDEVQILMRGQPSLIRVRRRLNRQVESMSVSASNCRNACAFDGANDKAMKIDIDKLTEEELIDLNHRIVERLRFLAQMKAHGAMLKFSIGQRVSFDPDGRPTVTGTLMKYNKKTVTVIADDGARWNVSPNYLREAAPEDVTPKRDNVVLLKPPG
jgi:hypothetical protein